MTTAQLVKHLKHEITEISGSNPPRFYEFSIKY